LSSRRAPLPALALTVALAAACSSSADLVEPDPEPEPTPTPESSATSTPPAEWPTGVETYENLTNQHTEGDVDYEMSPPVGGDHSRTWQNCGVYDEPIADENAVHSLEHGAVWLTYRTDLDDDQVEHLERLVGTSGFVLLSPYEEQDSPVSATAWGAQLQVEDATDLRVERFLEEYVMGEQSPEPGAPCTGGTGEPEQQPTT
jgi:hypothetical protein